MSEKNADDSFHSTENENDSDLAQALTQDGNNIAASLNGQSRDRENDFDMYLPTNESSSKKEENPFSFKKFLNQDLSSQKNKVSQKKVFATPASSTSSNPLDLSNHHFNRNSIDLNSRAVNVADKSFILPDFVKDHLVVDESGQSRNSSLDLNSSNHQSFPDLNLIHRNVNFSPESDKGAMQRNQVSFTVAPASVPDFAQSASGSQSGAHASGNNERPLEFGLDERTCESDASASSRSNLSSTSNAGRGQHKVQFSSSPSVPLDLPSYENNKSNPNLFIPFDLTAPAEEKTGSFKGRNCNETVSKSLPDFLSDGPIKKELRIKRELGINKEQSENLHSCRGNINLTENRISSVDASSGRSEERLHREIDLLRRQLIEKNRIIESLERDLELLHSTDQRETASLECALQEVENNLKQTAKRALNAEDMVLKLRQENKLLKSEISSLRSENVELRLGGYEGHSATPSDDAKNQKVAKELRSAASKAEFSLKSLLKGIENLRALADSMETAHKRQEESEEHQKDSAFGPSL